MGRKLTNISFAEWVTYVFDHYVGDAAIRNWYNEIDSDWWDPSRKPGVTVAYLTKVFENATSVLTPFSAAQIKEGFWFLVSPACSDHMFALLNKDVPWSERKRCINSIFTLFEQFLALQCSPHLSHLDEPGANPLNAVCYMWWDILPICGEPEKPDRAELDVACLDVMRRILDLSSDACRESALHGLGHWHLEYPEQVEAIINSFLDRNPALRSELKEYARAARAGLVL